MLSKEQIAEMRQAIKEWREYPVTGNLGAAIAVEKLIAVDAVYDLLDMLEAAQKDAAHMQTALEFLLERVQEPPEANCSCHLSPPCNDCVDYGAEREAFEFAKDAIKAMRRDCDGAQHAEE